MLGIDNMNLTDSIVEFGCRSDSMDENKTTNRHEQREQQSLDAFDASCSECMTMLSKAKLSFLQVSSFVFLDVIAYGGFGVLCTVSQMEEQNYFVAKVVDNICLRARLQSIHSEMAVSEGPIQRELVHPHIVPCFQLLENRFCYIIIQPFYNLGNAKTYIMQHGRATLAMIRRLIYDMAGALRYIHDMNLAHRDIKLENILLTRGNADALGYVLTDFGATKRSQLYNGCSTLIGTKDYMAPEILIDATIRNRYGQQVDIWAFGLTLYIFVPPMILSLRVMSIHRYARAYSIIHLTSGILCR